MYLFKPVSANCDHLVQYMRQSMDAAKRQDIADCDAIAQAAKWLAQPSGYDYEAAGLIFRANVRRANRVDWARALNELLCLVVDQSKRFPKGENPSPLSADELATCKRALMVMSFSGGHLCARNTAQAFQDWRIVGADVDLPAYAVALSCKGRTLTATLPQLEAVVQQVRSEGVPVLRPCLDFDKGLVSGDEACPVGKPLLLPGTDCGLSELSASGERTEMPSMCIRHDSS